MTEWNLENESYVRNIVDEKLRIASEGFDKQTRLAQLRAEYAALLTEQTYDNLQNASDPFEVSWLDTKTVSTFNETSLIVATFFGFRKENTAIHPT